MKKRTQHLIERTLRSLPKKLAAAMVSDMARDDHMEPAAWLKDTLGDAGARWAKKLGLVAANAALFVFFLLSAALTQGGCSHVGLNIGDNAHSAETNRPAIYWIDSKPAAELRERFGDLLEARLAAVPDATTNAPVTVGVTNLTLRSARWDKFPVIRFDAPCVKDWKKVTGGNNKTVCGILKLNGKKCEWIGAGRDWVSAHNATVVIDPVSGKPGKYYRPEFKSGDAIKVTLADVDGKNETNPQELIWP
jgi:hypothetical protein